MQTIVLVIHLMIALALVSVILLQRSEGGALSGLGGGGNNSAGLGGMMSSRSQANFLTRMTAILAASFMVTSLLLAIIASRGSDRTSILDAPATSVEQPALPEIPAAPAAPSAE